MGIHARLIDLFYRVATGERRVRTLLTPLGPVLFFSLLAALIIASVRTDRFFDFPRLLPRAAGIALSVPLVTAGVFLTLWSVLNFLRVKGTPVPFNPPPRLVTSGPYRYVRNPMVTGVFLALFGCGAFLGSVSLVFIFTPLLILFNVLELKAIEEPELERRLGGEYREYKKRVPMFFPRLKKGKLNNWKKRDRHH